MMITLMDVRRAIILFRIFILKVRKLPLLWREKSFAFRHGQMDFVGSIFAASHTIEQLETFYREAIGAAPTQDGRAACVLVIQRCRQAHAAIENLKDALTADAFATSAKH